MCYNISRITLVLWVALFVQGCTAQFVTVNTSAVYLDAGEAKLVCEETTDSLFGTTLDLVTEIFGLIEAITG